MKTMLKTLMIGVATSALLAGAASAEKIIIGHFGNPTPMQLLSTMDALEQETGWEIEWRKFAAGTDVIAAMASGDVVLSELGSSPLAIAASQGVDLQLIAFSDVIGTAESLIAHNDSGITSVADLKGKRIAVPVGSTAHFSLMGALQHEGIAETDVTIMNMPPDQIAAAWDQGVIDAAWVWQPVQSEILKTGHADHRRRPDCRLGLSDLRRLGGEPRIRRGERRQDRCLPEGRRRGQRRLSGRSRRLDRRQRRGSGPCRRDRSRSRTGSGHHGGLHLPADVDPGRGDLAGRRCGNGQEVTADFLKAAGRIDTVGDDYSGFVNTSYAEAAK